MNIEMENKLSSLGYIWNIWHNYMYKTSNMYTGNIFPKVTKTAAVFVHEDGRIEYYGDSTLLEPLKDELRLNKIF